MRTAVGATAVQIAEKRHGQCRFLEYLGCERGEAELAALMRAGGWSWPMTSLSWTLIWVLVVVLG